MKVLDLFSGLGGFSQAFRERGHDVTGLDIDRSLKPDIQADVRYLPIRDDARFDVILASPPCEEFSKDFMPWHEGDVEKGLELVYVTRDIIQQFKPRFWVVENVIGAVRYFRRIFGNYRQRCGSRYLWGNFPRFRCRHELCQGDKYRISPAENRSAFRAKIPYEITLNLCIAIENGLRAEKLGLIPFAQAIEEE